MKLLLDTHILLWWYLDSPDLPKNYLDLLTQAEIKGETLGVSVISLWEIAKLVSLGRLKYSFSIDHWFHQLEEDPLIDVIPLSGRIILESTRLGDGFHKDPADQLIVATARCDGLRLLTLDERIRKAGVAVI